jgi:2-hydroxycyclohexanecarboxyl-CoA dehydrogenase
VQENSAQQNSLHHNSLTGQIALVTGAGQGVGRAASLRLAAMGAAVAVNDVRAASAQAVVDEILAAGGIAIPAPADVTDYYAVGEMISGVVGEFATLDIVVNNAGNVGTDSRGWTMKPFWETEPDEWTSFVNVNLYGVMNCCRHALPPMIAKANGGRIITVVSDAARTGEPKLEVYAAAKAGAAGFTRSIAKSVGRYGITANSIALGTMWSDNYANMTPEDLEQRMRPYLVRRPGQPTEAAALIGFLAGPEASWITGQTYPLNGGISTS